MKTIPVLHHPPAVKSLSATTAGMSSNVCKLDLDDQTTAVIGLGYVGGVLDDVKGMVPEHETGGRL